AYDEMRRIIREEEPPKPSTRLSTLQKVAASTRSQRRGFDPRQLSSEVQGDLDWIVMKALEKDRNHRYESASAFVADVERYLNNEPVQARPPSALYRFRKFARRKKATLITSLAIAAGLLLGAAGLGGSVAWVVWDASSRREQAERVVGAALAEVDLLQEQALWPQALEVARRAEGLLAAGAVGAELRRRVEDTRAGLELVARLEEVRLEYADTAKDYRFDAEWADSTYSRVFRNAGFDFEKEQPGEL